MGHPAKKLETWNGVDPVCGMDVNPESPHRYIYNHIEYGFCSGSCLDKFRAQPEHYLKPSPDTDPVCGMDVSAESEYRFHFEGVEYRFCSEHCEKKFAVDPSAYLNDKEMDQAAEQEHA
ncbi:YHS domain-containing protein, partial [endosymbiont of Riftia pachyptila]